MARNACPLLGPETWVRGSCPNCHNDLTPQCGDGGPMPKWTRLALVLAMLALVASVGWRPIGRAVEAVSLLSDLGSAVAGAPDRPVPERQAIAFRVDERSYAGDLYLGAAPPKAALLLVPGLAPEGKHDPRLVSLALALARARFAVLVPDLAGLSRQRVGPENVSQIADALVFVAGTGMPKVERSAPRGIAAISYAVGPALLATLEPAVRGRVDFLVGIGGYFDIEAVIAYFTTGFYRDERQGTWRSGSPNEFGKWLFVNANAHRIRDPRDRVTLRAIAARRMRDPEAAIDDLVARLRAEGAAVHNLLANTDPERIGALVDALPPGLREDLRALDLRDRDLSQAPRHVILVHGRDDTIIPASESVALAAALPAGRAELYLADRLAHADLRPQGWRDLLRLAGAAYRLLALRDGGE